MNRSANERPSSGRDDDERDQRLADLLTQLSDRLRAGQRVELEVECAAHPDLAAELRQLWGAVLVADAVGGSSGASHADLRPDSPAADVARRAAPPTLTFGASTHPESDEGRRRAARAWINQVGGDQAAGGSNGSGGSSPRSDAYTMPPALPCVCGDYELLEEIGHGGMGVVYRARQLSLQREVAVKMMLPGKITRDVDIARFRAEAQAAAGLHHPGIVPVYDVSEWDGRPLFSMKYVRGETLAHRLAEGPLPAREAARLLAAVSRAVEHAHRHGILHRDLKPSNILIDRDGQPHITDFGLAKQTSDAASLTRTGAVLGTPAYMAPEQAAGARGVVSPATDVYSLGSILYHMLTGRPPFQAASPVDTLLLLLEQEPAPPRLLNPKADAELELIALRCLQKPPDLRYPSAASLADDLDAYLNDEPVAARTGRFGQLISRLFRETHHAPVLENWGLLWMWHSLVLVVVCLLTNGIYLLGDRNRWHYAGLWTIALWGWAWVFWFLRRRVGPVTFVERQIAHLWAGSMIGIGLLFPLETWLGLDVLTLSPVLAIIMGLVFLAKAAILSGAFYVQSAALFLSAAAMAYWPNEAHLIFGAVSAASFFVPGWKYHRQKLRLAA
ncbi:MAG: serine/threonine-protein kinase [Pirellulales bacterium]